MITVSSTKQVYALGGVREESRAAGVTQVRPIVLVFALAGALAALFLVVELTHERSPGRSALERFVLARRRRATTEPA